MTRSKRLFDVAFALVFMTVLAIPAALVATLLLLCQGRPIFYLSERMQTPERKFWLWKFRSMHMASADSGVSGGDKANRITKIGTVLRRTRFDEVPQLWNILCGEMSFVGPRPPLPSYAYRFPDLYSQVLQNRPGLTGLATLVFHKREHALLANCHSAAETDAIYARRCIPRKARIDMIYKQKQTLLLDIVILAQTLLHIFKKSGSA